MPSKQKQITEQTKIIYSPLGITFEIQTKAIEDEGEKQGHAFKPLEFSDKQLPSIKDFSRERPNP